MMVMGCDNKKSELVETGRSLTTSFEISRVQSGELEYYEYSVEGGMNSEQIRVHVGPFHRFGKEKTLELARRKVNDAVEAWQKELITRHKAMSDD